MHIRPSLATTRSPAETMSEPSKPTKLSLADAELLWAIFEQVPRRELSKHVDWAVIGTKLGGLNKEAVVKRWSRLNIKMRDGGDAGDMGDFAIGATEEIAGEVAAGTDGQKSMTKETGGGKSATQKRSRKAPVKNKAVTGNYKGVKSRATTWESVKADIAAEKKAMEGGTEEASDSDDREY
ncbi:hypothetical protein NHQ30_005041 [Ciborinia camelliae]|nr:hypothetical protein NHQ30_005041 [Ciborinia camelliae]